MASFETIVVPVSDLAGAKPFYRALIGAEPFVDSEYYVAFQAATMQLGLAPQRGMVPRDPAAAGPVPYLTCSDLIGLIQALTTAGGSVVQEPHGVGGGRTVATVADLDGNVFGLSHDGD